MKHEASIEGKTVHSSCDYVVHSDEKGLVAECESLEAAKQAWAAEKAKCNEWGVEPHLAIFRWSDGEWKAAIDLYQLQETDLERNPTDIVRFP